MVSHQIRVAMIETLCPQTVRIDIARSTYPDVESASILRCNFQLARVSAGGYYRRDTGKLSKHRHG
jgi:hypothetical protein